MADYRPIAPRANMGKAPVAPMGKVNTGNNYLVNQARQNSVSAGQPSSPPKGLATACQQASPRHRLKAWRLIRVSA